MPPQPPPQNLIPGFNPNSGNLYVRKPDTPNGDQQPQQSANPSAPAPGGYDAGPLHFGFNQAGVPGVSWSGSNLVPSSQAVHDWQNRATNAMGLNLADAIVAAHGPDFAANLAALRAEREQANQRMGPVGKLTADIAGQINPTQLLNAYAPGVGPALQGATQEGIRSYAAGKDWQTIGKDTLMGGVGGTVAGAFGNPKALGQLGGAAVETGVPAALGLHLGGSEGLLTGLLTNRLLKPAGEMVSKAGEVADEWGGEKARAAIQNLIMGGASSFIQNNPQPPPLPFFGYPGN